VTTSGAHRQAFTLLEVLLAVSILGIMSLMIFGSFRSLVESTTQAEQALDRLHQGEEVLDQLVRSLRSAAWFDSQPTLYAFQHEKGTGDPPDDMASWVSSTMAFLPPNYPTREGLNRIFLGIEEIDGETGLAVSAYPYMLSPDDEEVEEVEPWLISPRIKGFSLRYYDLTEEDWVDEWERDNQLPTTVEVTLYLEPLEPGGDWRKRVRRVDIPVGAISRATRRGGRQVEPSDVETPPDSGEAREEPRADETNRPENDPRNPPENRRRDRGVTGP